MNQKIKRSLEPSTIPKRTHKQQVLCNAIQQNHDALKDTIKAKVSNIIKNFGITFDLSCKPNSINTIATEILHNTVETVLNKSEEFDLNKAPFPWILAIAMYKVKGWQRDRTRSSKKVVSIDKFSSFKNNSSKENLLEILTKPSQSSNTEDLMMLEYLLSLVNESDRRVLQIAFVDDFNGKDLAAVLGVSEGTAYTRRHRALTRLKKAYIQANLNCQEDK